MFDCWITTAFEDGPTGKQTAVVYHVMSVVTVHVMFFRV